jgi:hypothetical protein
MHAKDTFKPETYVGLHAGVNLCRVGFNPAINQQLLSSFHSGIIFRHISEPNIGLQLEINYLGKGWLENRDTLGSYERDLHILEIPVMAAFIAGKKTFRVSFTIGPYLSYILKETEQISVIDSNQYRGYYQKPLADKLEFGFIAGLGFEIHTKFGAFALQASYRNGLTNLFPLNEDTYYYNGSRSQVIGIGLKYLIKI